MFNHARRGRPIDNIQKENYSFLKKQYDTVVCGVFQGSGGMGIFGKRIEVATMDGSERVTAGEVQATGMASPAQGYEAKTLDFNRLLVRNPAATFVMRMESSDMIGMGIPAGTMLVVDRSVEPRSGSLVILAYGDRFLCREMRREGQKTVFSNGRREIVLSPREFELFGTVQAAILFPGSCGP
jgi:DNA polymerase V